MTVQNPGPGALRLGDDLREQILAAPEALLGDAELMRALVSANDRAMGGNVVDLRGAAMRGLEGRLGQLETTHRRVIAAAYENLAGANLIHRAVLALLTPEDFNEFLTALSGPLPDLLRIDTLRLLIESAESAPPALHPWAHVVQIVPPGFIAGYLGAGPAAGRPVLLRSCAGNLAAEVHGRRPGEIRSEALLQLDPAPGASAALLVMGASEADQFGPEQATDLLRFFGAVFAHVLRRWLA